MTIVALTCPQCGGPLPRAAMWRMVRCPHCAALVTRASAVVERAGFRASLARSVASAPERRILHAGSAAYAVIAPLGSGEWSSVFLAERVGAVKAFVTLKIARDEDGAKALAVEARHLDALQALEGPGAAYFSMRLPRRIFDGPAVELGGRTQHVLILRHDAGVWGSLAAVGSLQPTGIDARHAVWIWRRALESLGYVHAAGWTHGDVGLDHLLVLPAEHGVQLIGWTHASVSEGTDLQQASERDLRRLAWSIRALLHGASADVPGIASRMPRPLAALLRQATEDLDWQRSVDAATVDRALVQAAQASFGTPRFIAFDPTIVGGVARG